MNVNLEQLEFTVIQRSAPSALVTIGDRTVAKNGWSLLAFDQHLTTEHLPNKEWCDMACLARTMFLRNTPDNRRKARSKIRGAFRILLKRGYFLAIEYSVGDRGKILRCKLLPATGITEQEQQVASYQLRCMHQRGEIAKEQIIAAQQLLSLT
jgi:hypothetical protein